MTVLRHLVEARPANNCNSMISIHSKEMQGLSKCVVLEISDAIASLSFLERANLVCNYIKFIFTKSASVNFNTSKLALQSRF